MEELIDSDGRCWNEELARDYFSLANAKEILDIPLSRYRIDDKLICVLIYWVNLL